MHAYPVSIFGAVAIAHVRGLDLTAETFRSYASKGRAPRPVTHEGRQPFWDSDELWSWAKPADRRRESEPEKPGPLTLEVLHLLPDAPGDELGRAYEAVLKLPLLIDQLAAGTAAHEEKYLRSARASLDPQIESFTLAALTRWFVASRRARQNKDATAEQLELTFLAQRTEAAARADLRTARAWLPRATAWAEWARRDLDIRADHAAFDRWLAAYAEQFTPPAQAYVALKTWCSADDRRVAYLHSESISDSRPEFWEGLGQGDRDRLAENRIELTGADFGYQWRVPGHPLEHRLSWNQRTGDLYLCEALRRTGSKVLPLASLPTGTTLKQTMDWLTPFEMMAGHTSAFGLLSLEIDLQLGTNWRSLRPMKDRKSPVSASQ